MTDVVGKPVLLDGEYHVLAGHGAPDQAGLTKRVRAQLEVDGVAGGLPIARVVGPMQPYHPDHVVKTADLRPISVPSGFAFVGDLLANADAGVLRYMVNYWFEHLGDHLQEIKLMGARGREAPISALQPGRDQQGKYSIAVIVDDDAHAFQTGSPFWADHIGRMNEVARESYVLNSFDVAIKRLGGIGDPAETTETFRQQLEQARPVLWRIPAAPVRP